MRLAGSARLSIIRIGYLPRDVPLGPLDSGITVSMRPIPALLSTVTAKGRRVCPGDKDGGQALELWEQARAALLAGLLARQLNAPRISLISFTRDREPIRKRIEEETHDAKFVVADRPYVAARPAWAFAEHGYMQEAVGGERTYFAPDESVLLDETFAGTHCMHVVAGTREHGGDVGIGFEPVELDGRDTLVDIKGVLWMDRKTPALRSLEFEYTGLESIGAWKRRATRISGDAERRAHHSALVHPLGRSRDGRGGDGQRHRATSSAAAGSHERARARLPRSRRRGVVGAVEPTGRVGVVHFPDSSAWSSMRRGVR